MPARPLTDEQIEETLAAINATRTPDGSINKRGAATFLGVPRATMQCRIRNLAAKGMLGFAPVLPGFEVKEVTSQLDASGGVKATSIKQTRERGEVYAVQKGQSVRGLSTLVTADGRIAQQWIKTDRDKIDPLDLAAQLRASFDNWSPSYVPPPPAAEGCRDRLAFYPISDLHVGMFSWGKETGEDWDLKIAKEVILDTYSKVFARTPETDEGIVLFGGDQLHADNYGGVTEMSGHRLDCDGRYPKTSHTLGEIAVEIVYKARRRHRKVRVHVLKGNHDRVSAVALAHFLYAWFRNDDAVEVDLSPSDFWFHKFGSVMLSSVHGDKIKAQDLPGKVAAIRPKMWGETIFRYCAYFHEHHDELRIKDTHGLVVEKHAIIAPAEAYSASGPFQSFRNAKSIIYDRESGEEGRAVVNVRPAQSAGGYDG
jgi:hypothetical protein